MADRLSAVRAVGQVLSTGGLSLVFPEDTKACTKCEVSKPISTFARHPGGRDGYTAVCRPCRAEERRIDRALRPEHYRVIGAAYYERNKDRARAYNLMKLYGITVEQFEALLEAQGGCCAICRRVPSGKGNNGILHVDHNHETMEIRGLLCHDCNNGLGRFLDDPEVLRVAACYLERAS